MYPRLEHRALYAAFDVYPSAKGAATHIARMARTLFDTMGGGLLYVVGDRSLPVYQREGHIEILRFAREHQNLLRRAAAFGRRLARVFETRGAALDICHFRDPWSGAPILAARRPSCATVYEVNGLPSIELPYAYPMVAPRTLEKIRAVERRCWSEADRIITPSHTIRDNLVALGAPAGRIAVIPNGADPVPSSPRPVQAPARYLIYLGALQPWQGVDVLLDAFASLGDLDDLHLVVCASTRARTTRRYRKRAAKLGLGRRTIWLDRLDKETLDTWLANAAISVAPLAECGRNLEQGCCPLKILESMSAGVPVVASDLPSVREIITHRDTGWLVRAGRPMLLARALRTLLEHPDEAGRIGERGRAAVRRAFSWERAAALQRALCRDLVPEVHPHGA